MKKMITVAVVILAAITLFACKEAEDPIDTLPVEEPDTINISAIGLEGEGTLESPYLLEINVGETLEKAIEITGTYTGVEYIYGQIDNQMFVADANQNQNKVQLNENNDDEWLSLKGVSVGEFTMRIKGTGLSSSAYINVKVASHDGSDPSSKNYEDGLKVLAVGNSFSEDAMTYLAEIANNYGLENAVFGYLYIGGASLEVHHTNMTNGTSSYVYWKNTTNSWVRVGSRSLLIGILDEEWDIITFQQASGSSGMPTTYQPYLDDLINYVRTRKSSPTTIMWHNTWAYAQTSTHSEFYKYQNNQITMFNAILSTMQTHVNSNGEFRSIIPSGVAIQNVRSSFVGDNVTRDGYHLNNYGRFVAGLAWFKTITGFSIDDITYRPAGVTDNQLLVAIEAVNNAYNHKFQVTNSVYTSND